MKGSPVPATLYTIDQAAEHLNTTPRFVRRLIAERRVAFAKLGRHVRITAEDLDAFIQRGRIEATLAADPCSASAVLMAGRRAWGTIRQLPSGRWQVRHPGPDGVLRTAPDLRPQARRRPVAHPHRSRPRARRLGRPQRRSRAAAGFRQLVARRAPRPGRDHPRALRERAETADLAPPRRHGAARHRRRGGPTVAEGAARRRAWARPRSPRPIAFCAPSSARPSTDGLIRRNPCRIKAAGNDGSPERPVLDVAQVLAAARAVPDRYRALVLVATFTSLRFGELAALQRERHRHDQCPGPRASGTRSSSPTGDC